MTKTKTAEPDKRTQKQKFIDAAREHGADGDADTFRNALKKIATASKPKTKKTGKPG
ncbi:MAG TPA: hypothetical protein VM620_03935 [Hyphomicrobium sp.]|nr:hypothetical protein [Hyphomicrobium sp.]